MEQSPANENVVMGNNETIEISMNDDIMEENVNAYRNKQKSKKWERKRNENKSLKIACIKKKLVITWKIVFVLEFLLCQW